MNDPRSSSFFSSILPFGLQPKTSYETVASEIRNRAIALESRDRGGSSRDSPHTDGSSSTHRLRLRGRCHCGKIRFQVDVPPTSVSEDGTKLIVWDCNCTICTMRRNTHLIVPKRCLRLSGETASRTKDRIVDDDMTTYRYGTCAARHMFCNICGISPFYIPRSNPDGFAVTFHCLQPCDSSVEIGKINGVEVRYFNGRDWENTFQDSDIKKQAT